MFDRLSGDFVKGYTRAIQDIIDIFDYVERDLAGHHKKLTHKMARQLLQVVLTEREMIRERIHDCFIRWNGKKNEFELWWRGK